ncbi:MAG: hypothetical protein ACOCUT_03470 [bacterium]
MIKLLFLSTFIFLSLPIICNGKSIAIDVISVPKNLNDRWYSYTDDSSKQILSLLKYLKRSPSGQVLIKKAQKKARKKGLALIDIIKPGTHSITDTTLFRKFLPEDPSQMVINEKSMVYINKELSFLDAILDLSHELTHFNFRPTFNPYKNEYNIEDFIYSTIQGIGGEADAIYVECKVLKELHPRLYNSKATCTKITNPNNNLPSHKMAIKQLYKIGSYYDQMTDALNHHPIKTKFSEETPKFISSAYGLPYPVASLLEFQTITKKVCENDKRRLKHLKNAVNRLPASQSSEGVLKIKKLERSINLKCQDHTN